MGFREIELRTVYRSASSDILRDFYIPCLSHAVRYDRAVGFFSATMLSYAAQGLSSFTKAGGRMRLVVGSALELDEEGAVIRGQNLRDLVRSPQFRDRLTESLLTTISHDVSELSERRLDLLEALVAAGVLEIRIAVRRRGMFHEKVGIMYDSREDIIVFQGSANETTYALAPDFNFESLNVFRNWREGDLDHAQPHIDFFEDLWNDRIPEAVVVPLPNRIVDELRKHKAHRSDGNPLDPKKELELGRAIIEYRIGPICPTDFLPRPYQRTALDNWKANGYRGILAMATGSGKTKTAIYAAERLHGARGRLFLMVAVPFKNLAEQWCEELQSFQISAIRCFESKANWSNELHLAVYEYRQGFRNFVAVVVVNRTLAGTEFQRAVNRLAKDEDLFFIGDECHNHGTPQMLAALPVEPGFRIGLSATFERHNDEAGTEGLRQYYGDVVFKYSLRDALHSAPPALCPYDYYVHFVEFTPREKSEYLALSARISSLLARSKITIRKESQLPKGDIALDLLLFQRARLIGAAQGKLSRLVELFAEKDPGPFALVYCGDGRVETDLDSDDLADGNSSDVRHIDAAIKALSTLGKKVGRYTYAESAREHRLLLDAFRAGQIEILAAIRCLDEGIDIPACRTAFILASSRNPRQFIQRRGRVLRTAHGKSKAVIHDFVVKIPEPSDETRALEKALLLGELRRVREFAEDASNSNEVFAVIDPVLDDYDLMGEFLQLSE